VQSCCHVHMHVLLVPNRLLPWLHSAPAGAARC
jgi:hypothetical protein